METRKVNLGSAFKTAWEYFKKNGIALSVTYLIAGIAIALVAIILVLITGAGFLGTLLALMANPSPSEVPAILGAAGGAMAFIVVLGFVMGILGSLFEVAMDNLSLGLMSGRFARCTFDAANLPASVYVKVLVVNILVGILCGLSLALLVIPFFFVAPRLIMATRYQVDHPEAGIIESISASWDMTKGNTLMLLVYIIIVGVASSLLSRVYVVGPVVTSSFCLLLNTALYYQLKGQEVKKGEAPQTEGDSKLDISGYSKEER